MEKGLIIQLLVIAGVIGYGAWSAVRKSEKDGNKGQGVPSRHLGGENFPFPSSSARRMEEVVFESGRDAGGDTLDRAPVMEEHMEDHLAVASIQADAADFVSSEVAEGKLDLDLRTMIISSELLKPKYQEY